MKEVNFSEEELKRITPQYLLEEKDKDEVADFFLVLSVFYNDLKSLMFYHMQIDGIFEKLGLGGSQPNVSVVSGEYGGMKNHLERMIVGTVFEFFEFIKTNQKILKPPTFREVYNKLDKDRRFGWDVLIEIAINKTSKKDISAFSKILLIIQNNLAFHYSQGAKMLRQGYVRFFYEEPSDEANQHAYYALGKTMGNSRFFYADAAATASFRVQVEKEMSYSEFMKEFRDVIDAANFAIMRLLEIYLAKRRNRQ